MQHNQWIAEKKIGASFRDGAFGPAEHTLTLRTLSWKQQPQPPLKLQVDIMKRNNEI